MSSSSHEVSFGNIDGVRIWQTLSFSDNRGRLFKPVGSQVEIDFSVVEVFFTESRINVVRGMHLQILEHPANKIVSLISGAIVDYLVDIRPYSSTFLKCMRIELDSADIKSVFVPKGVAHGYRVMRDRTVVMYAYDNVFCLDCDIGFNVKSVPGLLVTENPPILSKRDFALPELEVLFSKYRNI